MRVIRISMKKDVDDVTGSDLGTQFSDELCSQKHDV